jgi:hypothetical protein
MPYREICLLDACDIDRQKHPIPPQRVKLSHDECVHTPCPEGYLQWHEWARQASKTHAQVKCERCGLWAVWLPKAEARAINKSRLEALNRWLKSQGYDPITRKDYGG